MPDERAAWRLDVLLLAAGRANPRLTEFAVPKHRPQPTPPSQQPLSWLPNATRGFYWLVKALLAAHGHWDDLW